MCFNHELHEFSRIGSGFAGEFCYRFYSCLFAKFLVYMCSAWADRQAEDLGVPIQRRVRLTAGFYNSTNSLGLHVTLGG